MSITPGGLTRKENSPDRPAGLMKGGSGKQKAQEPINAAAPIKGIEMTNPELTFSFIRDYIAMHGYGPTTSDLAIGIKVSRQTAHEQLDLIEEFGWIQALRGPKGYRILRTMKITR